MIIVCCETKEVFWFEDTKHVSWFLCIFVLSSCYSFSFDCVMTCCLDVKSSFSNQSTSFHSYSLVFVPCCIRCGDISCCNHVFCVMMYNQRYYANPTVWFTHSGLNIAVLEISKPIKPDLFNTVVYMGPDISGKYLYFEIEFSRTGLPGKINCWEGFVQVLYVLSGCYLNRVYLAN